MYVIALMYGRGEGVNADPEKASQMMQSAAKAGSSHAEEWLEKHDSPIKLVEELTSTAG